MDALFNPAGSPALVQFVDDELLRAPLLFDQVVEGALDNARKALPGLAPLPRAGMADLIKLLKNAGQAERQRLSEHFVRSLREQVRVDIGGRLAAPTPTHATSAKTPLTLALLDEDEVALDVALSHTITTIKSTAEYELRELQTFTAALVGDMSISSERLPLRADTYARALCAAAQALPLPRAQQAAFMQQAGTPLALLLRQSFAASCSRLEAMGVEPAAYRTLILPAGSRGGLYGRSSRQADSTYSPDLLRMRDDMPTSPPPSQRIAPVRRPPLPARGALPDLRALELVRRLFEAITADTRVPPDVLNLVLHLHDPALRLSQHDAGMLDHETHPLWLFINRLAYEAEMAPDPADPERLHLLKVASATINQLAREPEPSRSLFAWALERLENFLQQRLARRCQALAGQITALQKLEDKLNAGTVAPTTLHGTLDVLQLDTVPAAMLPDSAAAAPATAEQSANTWLDKLMPGDWLRIFLQGGWFHVQLIWPGDRRDIWLLGDGASNATWAIRRRALATLWDARLVKSLARRSLLGQAAKHVNQRQAAA